MPGTEGHARTLAPGQRCEVWIVGPGVDVETLVLTTDDVLLEAPNWTLDGSALILNGAGVLWRLDLRTGTLDQVQLSGVPELNNDHVLAPDGHSIYLSANDGHIYRADLAGGPGVRVTANDGMLHYLHGVRPDGRQLAYVGIPAGDHSVPGRLYVAPADGPGPPRELATGEGHVDGSEYSRMDSGSTSTPRPSPPRPGMPRSDACEPTGTVWSDSSAATRSTGFRICLRTASLPPICDSLLAPGDILPIWPWRSY